MRHPGIFLLLILGMLFPDPGAASPSPWAADRGSLSLAWDAHEAGLFEEALAYLAHIRPPSEVATDAVWLQAECLYDLGRYGEAAAALDRAPLIRESERREFLTEVFWSWAWAETAAGDYAEAVRVLEQGLERVPGEGSLEALREASRFRGDLARAVAAGEGRLRSGERAAVRPLGSPPPGTGWVRVYPWDGRESPWLPEVTLEDWMPGLAERLRSRGEALWVSLPPAALTRALGRAAARIGLGFERETAGGRLSRAGRAARVQPAEWLFRGGVEGLGVTGAALAAVARAEEDLSARERLSGWVEENRGSLEVRQQGDSLVLRHPATGRSFELQPESWSDLFGDEPDRWLEFWADLRAELARPPSPFRCFCGRPVTLRETLVADPSELLVLERGTGYATAAVALCPLHHQRVTAETARQWGVGTPEVVDRVRTDARRQAWELQFARGETGGFAYLVLDGDGASSLARSPEFLAGALETVEGVEARGRSVRVRALTGSALVVTDAEAPEHVGEEAAVRSLLALGRRGDRSERIDYCTTLRLPAKGAGLFRVSLAE